MMHLHPVDTARRTGVPGNPLAGAGVYRVGGGALDDAEAVALAQRGDLDAYEHLVGKYTAPAHRAAALLGAGDDADDVVQEAFVKAYRKLRLCRTGETFRPWLLAIVANETRNLHRSRRRRDALVLKASAAAGEPVTGPDEPAAAALAEERRRQLTAALGTLDELHRDVLICRYLLDLSEQETADALGCSRGTVKSRTFRALGRLRTRLDAGRREEVDRA